MQSTPITVLIFDLTGVIFTVHTMSVIRSISSRDLLFYFLRQRKNPIDEGIMILDKMRREVPGQFQESVGYKGTFLPLCFLQWNQGLLSRQEAFDQIKSYFKILESQNYFKDERHKKILFELLNLIFSSALGLKAFKPIQSTVNLIKRLKKQGKYHLYVLSNIDQETIDGLQKLYAPIFNYFDGIVVSCYSHCLKPERAMYEYLLKKYNVNPLECCFIDDQLENVKAAEQLGMQTIHCIKPSALTRDLKNKGLL